MNESDNRTAVQAPSVEQVAGNESNAAHEMPTFDTPVHIHVISYRARKHDPDGISVKAALDGIVALGILRGDSQEEIKRVTFESYKSKVERTIIEITDALVGEEAAEAIRKEIK